MEATERTRIENGVAFAFSDCDTFAGVDLDDCLDSEGQFEWGFYVVSQLDSYCAISPLGPGVKLFLRGVKPASAQCRVDGLEDKAIGKLEIYDRARCFAVTGRRVLLCQWMWLDLVGAVGRGEPGGSGCSKALFGNI